MRIVLSPSREDGSRNVTVYNHPPLDKALDLDADENEQVEIELRPKQHANVNPETSPRDAGEIWAEVDVDEYRVLGE